jgi:hypothetical protein
VRRWWTKHGLPKCMHCLKEENQVSFVSRALPYYHNFHFLVLTTEIVLQVEGDDIREGDGHGGGGGDGQSGGGGDGADNHEADDEAATTEALEDATWNVVEDDCNPAV